MLIAMLMSLMLGGQVPCGDDYEAPECAAEQIAEATRNLSLPDIQAEFDAGVQVYRAVFDGGRYGRPAVSFERRPGQSPELVVYGAGGRTLRREIGAEVWESVRDRSRYAGRKLEPTQTLSISCYASSDVVVQIASPHISKPDENPNFPYAHLFAGGLIEASQNSCEGGLTWDYGAYLADLACEQIPECDAMGARDRFLGAVFNLRAVFQLRGDRLAAASLSASLGWPPARQAYHRPVEAAQYAHWLEPEYGATLDWKGTIIKAEPGYDNPAPDAISRFLAEQDVATGGLRYEVAEIGADSADIGWVTGVASYPMQTEERGQIRQAPWRQVWLRSGDNWRLWSMTVGEFAETGPAQQ